MRYPISWAMVLMMAAATSAGADSIKVEPGKWEFRSEATMMPGQPPKTNVTTECIEDGDVDPDKFMEGDETCRISDVTSSGSELKWKMTCPGPQGTLTGDAVLRSKGTTVSGSMNMRMEVGGQVMQINNSWQGRRIGACD